VSISVVVPCHNSAPTLPRLIARLSAVLPAHASAYEIILVVDDGDRATWHAADRLRRIDHHVHAFRLSRNYGQHNALVAGVREARHDVVITMDDDLQHRPEEIPALLATLTDEIDLVYGIAAEEEHGTARSLASRSAKALMERGLGVRSARHISAFRAFRTFLRDGFTQLDGPDVSLDVALSWGTTKIAAATVVMDQRTAGRSNYTVRKLVKHTLNMFLGYSAAPLRLVTYLGFLVGTLGVALLCRVLFLYFSGGTTIAGFTTVASMVAVFSAAQMIAIGILGEYIGRIHGRGQGRPAYLVRPDLPAPDPAGRPDRMLISQAEGRD
jgi:undecaprenyl-phosphate 4-deoxy-4-formamido-L-arabinose transferase